MSILATLALATHLLGAAEPAGEPALPCARQNLARIAGDLSQIRTMRIYVVPPGWLLRAPMSPDSLQTHYDYMASVELSGDPDMQFILGSALERTMIIGPPSDPSSEHQVDARYGLTLANKDDVVTFSLFLSRPSRDTGIINGQPCQTEAGPMWGFVRRQFSFMDTTL